MHNQIKAHIEKNMTLNSSSSFVLTGIISNMPGYVFWKNKNHVYMGCNNNLVKAAGLNSPSDFIGKTDQQLPWAAQAYAFQKDDDRIIKSGKPIYNIEEKLIHADGTISIVLTNKVPLCDEQNHIIGVLAIGSDITDRKKLEEELLLAKEKAEAGERAKTEFIANISHDVRTPITGILGYSEYLKSHLPVGESKEIAEDIYQGGKQLLGLLNDVLQLSSIDTCGEEQVVHKSFDLYQLIDDLCELEKPAIKSHHLELHQYIDKKIPRYLISDKMKIHRVLLNLIGNAIKFTKEGSVTLEVKLLENTGDKVKIEFSVKDTGIGIPDEAQPQVFKRFYKVSPSYKGKFTGNGIGLHIVQKYTHLLGGEIHFKSKVGEGTTFSFALTLPLGEATTNHDADYDTLLEEEKSVFRDTEQLPHFTETKDVTSGKKRRVLLIEDNAMALRTLKLRLKEFPLSISEAMDAEIAFELIKQKPFDLIITDIGLPGISGDELVVLIRAYEKKQGLKPQKIVALTGHATEGEFNQKCIEAGINALYQKPIETSVLKNVIEPLFKKTEEEKRQEEDPKPKTRGRVLGIDLPDTEEELFQIAQYPLFDAKIGAKVLGSEGLARELHQDFKKTTIGEDLEKIKEFHKKGDWEEVEKLSHKIKGGSCYGTVRLYYALLYIERYLKAGHKKLAEKLYTQMLHVIEETLNYLDKNLN